MLSRLQDLLASITDTKDIDKVAHVAKQIRAMIASGIIPQDLAQEIETAYRSLCREYKARNLDVAVRSSATAEDLPGASFAGQQETYLGVRGAHNVLESCKKVFASLFTQRAIIYRMEKGFEHTKIGISIAVQKMVRSDKAVSGVAFSLDTESGFKNVVVINAAYGLGEAIVQGIATPDEYVVFKPTLSDGKQPIIKKKTGSKKIKMVYGAGSTVKHQRVSKKDQLRFCLSDNEIAELANMISAIEAYFSEQKHAWVPVDVEWAKDGNDNKIYIVQSRPETVHAQEKQSHSLTTLSRIAPDQKPAVILTGQSIGQHIVSGIARS